MVKAGLIGAVVGFIYVMGLALLMPFCPLCFTPILGLSVGYLAANEDEPDHPEASLRRGTIAAGVASVGVLIGQILASLVSAVLATYTENLSSFITQMGVPPNLVIDPDQYWLLFLLLGSSCSLLNMMITVGLGAVGGQIWFRRQRRFNDI